MKTKGIIISSIDYKETSKLVNILTPNGKMAVVALGSKKVKNGLLGFITTGNIVSFVSTDNNLSTLIEYNLEYSIYDKLNDIKSIEALGVIISIINHLDFDNNYFIYNFIEKTIKSIDQINIDKLISIYLIKMLYCFGIKPALKSCVKCGNIPYTFDVIEGGALCKNCSNIKDDNMLLIWDEYYYKKSEFINYNDCDFKKLIKEIKDYYNYHLSYQIKYD